MAASSNDGKALWAVMVPILCCFFCMGFVDMCGIASNYVKQDLGLSDTQANIFPSLVFFWFLIFGVPVGMLMNKIGRKKTVLLSMLITLLSLLIPIVSNSFFGYLVAFSLLGIGNAFMQTSLNPLVSNIIDPRHLASTLTFGQFIKAIASFIAPIMCGWGAVGLMPIMGLGWKGLFPIFAIICLVSTFLMWRTTIEEAQPDKASGIKEVVVLLKEPFIFLCFIGIMCHVGIDVGTNVTAPRILVERLGIGLEEAGFATSVYFIFRTLGCLSGAGLLRKIAAKPFFIGSVILIALGLLGLTMASSKTFLYVCMALVGLGNSNVFSVIFSQALLHKPDEGNEVSGLMIMGIFGGTVFPFIMGIASDASGGQAAAVIVMIIGAVYLLAYSAKIRSQNL